MLKLKLNFLSSYESSLYHFVEKFSLWDEVVSPDFNVFLQENFELDSKDNELLARMKSLRKSLGWDFEVKLHEWAYQKFPKHDAYSPLLEIVKHFESKLDKNGKTLGEYLKGHQDQVDKIKDNLEEQYNDLDLEATIVKMQVLLAYKPDIEEIPAFIVLSPTPRSLQGGANGEGITVEVNSERKDNKVSLMLVVHEFVHRAIDASYYFTEVAEQDVASYFSRKDLKFTDNNNADYMEELIVRSVVDVRIFGESPKDRAENYSRKSDERRNYYARSWSDVAYISPIIDSYLDEKIDIDKTRLELIQTFKSKIIN